MVVSGGCLCGSVRYEATSEPVYVCICHCNSCRKAAGAVMVGWVVFAAGDVRIVRGALKEHASSAGVVRGHCADCGTSISYRTERRQQHIDLTMASLDDPAAFKPVSHVWVEDKLPWVVICDDLPQYQKTV